MFSFALSLCQSITAPEKSSCPSHHSVSFKPVSQLLWSLKLNFLFIFCLSCWNVCWGQVVSFQRYSTKSGTKKTFFDKWILSFRCEHNLNYHIITIFFCYAKSLYVSNYLDHFQLTFHFLLKTSLIFRLKSNQIINTLKKLLIGYKTWLKVVNFCRDTKYFCKVFFETIKGSNMKTVLGTLSFLKPQRLICLVRAVYTGIITLSCRTDPSKQLDNSIEKNKLKNHVSQGTQSQYFGTTQGNRMGR